MNIKHYAVTSLPPTPNNAGEIYFTIDGSQYISTTTSFVKISDLLFVDDLPQYGQLQKLYLHDSKLKIWNGIEYIEVGGGQSFDDTQLKNNIAQLQSDLTTLQGKMNVAESKIATNENKISTLETKISDLESQSSNDLADLQVQVDTIEGNVSANKADILVLGNKNDTTNTKVSELEKKITVLETELSNVENGQDGISAYQIAVNNGFVGSESQWLLSLKGENGKDGINGVDGSDAQVTAENIETALGYKPASVVNFNVFIPTNWTGSEAPYTQTINVDGILETDSPFAYPIYNTNNNIAILEDETWSMIGNITTSTNNITVSCFEEKPTTALTIQLKVVR